MALVTTEFWAQGDFVARSVGMPDVPRVKLPHPVASSGAKRMAAIALEVRASILAALAAQAGDASREIGVASRENSAVGTR